MRFRLVVLLLAFALFAGCKEGSFLKKQTTDFTAKYNGYYNAKKAFDEGVKNLERQTEKVDQELYTSIFPASGGSGGSQFQDAVDKAAEMLRKHPDSKWVDDALMLIGKAWFYQENYVGAEQKFREIIDLGPGKLADEARFFLARTLVAGKSYDSAIEELGIGFNQETATKQWLGLWHLVMAELYIKQENWQLAAEEIEVGLPPVKDRDVKARAQFLLGQVYETAGDHEKAAEAYGRVPKFKPIYELEYAARYNNARMIGLHLDPEEGQKLVRRMQRDDKNFEVLAELELLEAKIYHVMDEADEAFHIYDELLYDPNSKASSLAGRIHYAFANLYKEKYEDYFLAGAHFDTAASRLRQTNDPLIQKTPFSISNARDVADVYASFSTVAGRLDEVDSLLYLGSLGEAEFDSAIAVIEENRKVEAARKRAEMERRRAESSFGAAATGSQGRSQTRSSVRRTGGSASQYGFLNYKSEELRQDEFTRFQDIWGDRPLVENWRRSRAITASIALQAASGEDDSKGGLSDNELSILLPPLDLTQVPRDSAATTDMLNERANLRYELANVLFLQMNMPDSAIAWYRYVIDEEGDKPVAQRAYYALAELQTALGDTLSARRLYQYILSDFPDSEFAGRANERLRTGVVINRPDSATVALTAYERILGKWRSGELETAFDSMLVIAALHPKMPAAPKALLAGGLIYEQMVAPDTLALFEPIQLSEFLEAMTPAPDTTAAEMDIPVADSLGGIASADSAVVGTPEMEEMPDLAAMEDNMVPSDEMTEPPLGDEPGPPLEAARPKGEFDDERLISGLIPNPLRLERLYASIESNFPGTSYADRAKRLKSYLEERKPKPVEALPDSMATDSLAIPADSLLAGVGPAADSLGMESAPEMADLQKEQPPSREATYDPEREMKVQQARSRADAMIERANQEDSARDGAPSRTPLPPSQRKAAEAEKAAAENANPWQGSIDLVRKAIPFLADSTKSVFQGVLSQPPEVRYRYQAQLMERRMQSQMAANRPTQEGEEPPRLPDLDETGLLFQSLEWHPDSTKTLFETFRLIPDSLRTDLVQLLGSKSP